MQMSLSYAIETWEVKRNNIRILEGFIETVYLSCWAVYFFYLFVSTTMFTYPAWFLELYNVGITVGSGIAVWRLLNTWFEDKTDFFLMLIFLIIGIRYQILRHDMYMRDYVLMLIAAKNVDFTKITVISLIVGISTMISAFIASQIGIIEDLIYEISVNNGLYKSRHSFGICYTTDFAAHVFFLLVGYLYLRQGKLHMFEYMVIAISTYVMFKYTRTRNSTICIYLLLAATCAWQFLGTGRQRESHKDNLMPIFTIGSIAASTLCIVISLFCTVVYPENKFFRYVDTELLGKRHRMGHQAFLDYGIHLTGSDIPQMGSGRTTAKPDWYFFLDISYITVLLCRGLAVFIMMLLITGKSFWRHIKNNNIYPLILFAVILLQCSVEHHWAEPQYNFFYLIPFAALPDLAKQEH